MTYNLSETTNVGGEGNDENNHHHHHQPHHLLNRTNSLLVAEELLNEINHANLAHNHNMSYNCNLNISNISDDAANFINSHMPGHHQLTESSGDLHRTREVENLVDLVNESSDMNNPMGGDDLIKAGLEMIHGVSHLKRTHEIENINEASQDD